MTSIRRRLSALSVLSLAAALVTPGCIVANDSFESGESEMETEEVASVGQALSVSDLAYRLVNLRSDWGCPGYGRCEDHLSWTALGDALLYPKDDTQDLVPWRLVPVPGKTDEFYIRSEWHCPEEGRCDAHLSWFGDGDVKLVDRYNTADLVPWKFIPVPGTTDQFYIRNRWSCPTDSRCDKHLSWSGTGQIKLYPKDNTADLVPWRVVASPATSDRFGAYFRNPAGGRPPISYTRGAGTTPDVCPAGQELVDGLCYTPCADGYTGVGPVCWGSCPAGYTDNGASCFRGAEIISSDHSSCPWYDACGLTFAAGCSSCPSGYVNDGCTCRRDASTVWKASYGRGAGVAPTSCSGGKVLEAGLCYAKCDPGYKGVGSECVVDSFTGLCTGLYDATLAKGAVTAGVTMTFGIGAGIANGQSMGVETGMAYGEHGEYGCYTQTCTGSVTDGGINAWASFGTLFRFADVDGASTVTFVGASAELVGASSAVVTSGSEVQGTQGSVSLGVGLCPVQIGIQTCNATVTRIW